MGSASTQLIVLAIIAVFLILKLRSVLGTRDGFEPKNDPAAKSAASNRKGPNLTVLDGGVDADIADHVDVKSMAGKALAAMKRAEPSFTVDEFLAGSRQAYEMILMAFEGDDLETLQMFLSEDAYESFKSVIDARQEQGLKVDAQFVGIRQMELKDASFDGATNTGEITVFFECELTSVVKNEADEIIEGDKTAIKRQRDEWTFARTMGSDDPNWELVETGG